MCAHVYMCAYTSYSSLKTAQNDQSCSCSQSCSIIFMLNCININCNMYMYIQESTYMLLNNYKIICVEELCNKSLFYNLTTEKMVLDLADRQY